MIEENGFYMDFFKYNPDKNTVKINISEYEHNEKEFDVNTELNECIFEINRLYNKCNDDRIIYDTDANTEFYTREAIQYIPQKHLNMLSGSLEYIADVTEKLKVESQIEILKEVVEEIDRLLD